ncbi:hypothetical protein QVD17_15550 [Tagetes erecta]|uniref:Uncharacterized protein n=1 Tax=Tagetes erecta TaxID=13708 RepID=A0AAD8NSQ9_TARER|nr:hypothetical protein QVD17_15550 [Tagetes erecta]
MTVLTLLICPTVVVVVVVEAAEEATVVVVIDAETTTEMVGQIGIIMVEAELAHTDEQKLNDLLKKRPVRAKWMIYVLQMLLYGRLRFSALLLTCNWSRLIMWPVLL